MYIIMFVIVSFKSYFLKLWKIFNIYVKLIIIQMNEMYVYQKINKLF